MNNELIERIDFILNYYPLDEIGDLLRDCKGAIIRQRDDTHGFKNFHRSLCDRFGYTHDQIDWRRDQVSLIEHIASLTQQQEAHPDDIAVMIFAEAMKAKMAASREKGRTGWDDPVSCSGAHLAELLVGHVEKGDPVDIANFCMMIHQRGISGHEIRTAWSDAVSQQQEAEPYGYLRENDGAIQISIGPERPADRSGGYATPWVAIYARPPKPAAQPTDWPKGCPSDIEVREAVASFMKDTQTLPLEDCARLLVARIKQMLAAAKEEGK